jgi:hypothetical protein
MSRFNSKNWKPETGTDLLLILCVILSMFPALRGLMTVVFPVLVCYAIMELIFTYFDRRKSPNSVERISEVAIGRSQAILLIALLVLVFGVVR